MDNEDHKDLILLKLIFNCNMIPMKISFFFLEELSLELIENKHARIVIKNISKEEL